MADGRWLIERGLDRIYLSREERGAVVIVAGLEHSTAELARAIADVLNAAEIWEPDRAADGAEEMLANAVCRLMEVSGG